MQEKSAPRLAILIATGMVVAAALALILVRGPALMLDLSAMAGMLCF